MGRLEKKKEEKDGGKKRRLVRNIYALRFDIQLAACAKFLDAL